MPQHQQPPANQVVDLAFLVGEPVWLHRDGGGNNGVVVADLAVIHIALAQGTLAGSRSQVLLIAAGNNAYDLGNRRRDIGRKVTAVGPGIADELVLLIERLGHVERFLCAEAVKAVGMPLQSVRS